MLCALIMAGGKGSRFWPLSTEEKPKQFLRLISEDTMLQMTVNRIKEIIPMERIFICTGERYKDLVKEQLSEISDRNIIIEPEGRNTAPCISLSALYISRYYKDATMLVLPADHLITEEDKFREVVLKGYNFIEENEESILTIGIKPTRAEVGYGYIKYEIDNNVTNNLGIIKVDKFVEKPDLEKAKEYLNEGCYLWNGGMFLWKCKFILEEIRRFLPTTYEALHSISEVNENELTECINKNYGKCDCISIDYAVLEKSKNMYVIPSEFGWDDVGSWNSLERYRKRDSKGNILMGNIRNLDGENNIIIGMDNELIINKVSNIFVIQNDGKIIVGNRNDISNIQELK